MSATEAPTAALAAAAAPAAPEKTDDSEATEGWAAGRDQSGTGNDESAGHY